VGGNEKADAQLVARAEAALEKELPTRRLTLAEAKEWLERVAHAEDVDPPLIIKVGLPRCVKGALLVDDHVLVVPNDKPSQLTLLHELAHAMGCAGHGPRFRETLSGLLRQHVSLQHGLCFQRSLD
jgi:hypothetical protein